MPGPTAGASPVGSAATIPHSTAQAIPAIQAEAIVEAAAAAEPEAIDRSRLWAIRGALIYRRGIFLDSFQSLS